MNIIVTGASSGVGFELSRALTSSGEHRVVAIARRRERLMELQERCPAGTIIPLVADITTLTGEELLSFLDENGFSSVDVLVNNAGYLVTGPFLELTPDDWKQVYETNVFAPVRLTQYLLPRMGLGSSPSHVVMIGSIGGVTGTVKFPGLTAYTSSKGAVGIFAEVLAEELKGKNIMVNTVALGSVQTEMLEKAFPGYHANTTATEVSGFLSRFCLTGQGLFNGKTVQMSTGTP